MAEKASDPEELEREIERTRDELASTIDALVDRVSPRNVMQRGVTRVKEEAQQVVAVVNSARQDLTSGLRQPRDTPPGASRLPADIPPPVLIGAGVVLAVTAVFLLRRRRRS